MLSREQQPVELVDDDGHAVGSATVAQAHRAPGRRHRAFSVLLLTPDGARLLLQRRSAAKLRFPSRWANACCGHPGPGEAVPVAARRRLREELGVAGVDLTEIGVYRYRAADPASGLVEDEHDHVLLGRLEPGEPLRPDPAEVAELRWVTPGELSELMSRPDTCAPWLAGVTGTLAATVGRPWTDAPPRGA